MNNYKISIIVPVYNAEKYIRKCVASLMGQTYSNLEILLVNDGSTDGSGSICEELKAGDPRIRVIHKENGGLISAWKRGVEESTGEYLNFIDSDDWVDLNMMEEMSQMLTGNDKEMIVSDYVIEREDGSRQYVFQKLSPGIYERTALREQVIPNLLGRESRYVTISRCMKLIAKRLIVENCKYSDPRIVTGEDTTIMLPVLIDCERLVVMDHKAYYHYFYVGESMIHKYSRDLFENICLLRKITGNILKDKFQGEELEQRLWQLNQESVFWMLLVLKNEARGNAHGYMENIRRIAKDPEIRELVRNTKVEIHETANRLLYLVLKHPNYLMMKILRLSMIWYYRKA